jgi:hypothetical protein
MTCSSFDASQKIHLYVHPSDLRLIRFARPVRASPWISPAASRRSLAILHAPDGDGIEHYPGSVLRTTSLMRLRVALDTTSVAYVLCRIEDDASLTPISEHEDIVAAVSADKHQVEVEDSDFSYGLFVDGGRVASFAACRIGYREWARRSGRLGDIHSIEDRYDHDIDELMA